MYNSSTKAWKVPVNGLYQVTVSHVFGNSSGGGMMTILLKKTQQLKSYFTEQWQVGIARGTGTGTQGGTWTFTVQLQATEQVTVWIGADVGGTANFGSGPYGPACFCSVALVD
jgi:hypothetical protein